VERFFMGVALVRVLFAHSLLTAPRLAPGHLGAAGRVLGDPADAGPTRSDYGVILPRVRPVYAQAAADLGEPRLLDLLRDGWPVYAWPYDQRDAWTTTRAPLAMRVVSGLTARRPGRPDPGAPGQPAQGGLTPGSDDR
jgi:hypothetical protein